MTAPTLYSPSFFARCVAAIFHLYPLSSGCGTSASSKVAKWLVKERPVSVIGRFRRARCIVPLDDLVGRAIYRTSDFDPKVSWAVTASTRKGDTVLDVGANLGLIILLFGAIVGRNGNIHLFEPNRDLLALLRQSIAMNPQFPITLHEHALGRDDAELRLNIPTQNAGRASLIADQVAHVAKSYKVPVRPLSGILSEEGVSHIEVMKIDTEGFEEQVILGLFDDDKSPRPAIILLEDHKAATSPTFALLGKNGNEIFGLPIRLFKSTLVSKTNLKFENCHDFVAVHDSASADRRLSLGLQSQR